MTLAIRLLIIKKEGMCHALLSLECWEFQNQLLATLVKKWKDGKSMRDQPRLGALR